MPLKSSRIAEIYAGLQNDHANPDVILLAEQMLIESLSPLQAQALEHIREKGHIGVTHLAGLLHIESHYAPRVPRILTALGLIVKERQKRVGLPYTLWTSAVYGDREVKAFTQEIPPYES